MGIGWNGKTLLEMLEESESVFKATNRYCGLERLSLKEEDPLKFERFQWRLINACIGARDTVKYACASPGTRELGELIFMIYTPEGDCLAHSMGLVSHILTESRGIKYMLRANYENDPGIRPGDIFWDNDPYLGGAHPADARTFIPFFWEGELLGWIAGIAHELETGGMVPGSFNPISSEMFTDGFRLPLQKVGENDKLNRGFLFAIERASRNSVFWVLDEKAKTAGCQMIRERMAEIVAEFGVDYYKLAIREIIEDGRRSFLARIKERMVPGIYRSPLFFPITLEGQTLAPYASKNSLVHLPAKVTIGADGAMTWDYDGASKWGYHPMNMYGGADHVLYCILVYHFCYDARANGGIDFAVRRIYPAGTIVNPMIPFAGSGIPWAIHTISGSHQALVLAQGLFSRGYLEEVQIVSGGGWRDVEIGGVDANGKPYGATNFEFAALSTGARAVDDGAFGIIDWMPEADMGNAEIWEVVFPNLIYLGRSFLRDSFGNGRFRGANGWQTCYMVHQPPAVYYSTEGSSGGSLVTQEARGLFGGYPAVGTYSILARKTNVHQLITEERELPFDSYSALQMLQSGGIEAQDVSIRKGQTGIRQLEDGDIYVLTRAGGGGLGDPLERDPVRVKNDLDNGEISYTMANRVNGVVASFDEATQQWVIDLKATEEERARQRAQRKTRGIPVAQWWRQERERVSQGKLPQVIKEMYIECEGLSESFYREYSQFWQLNNNLRGE